MIIFVAGMPRAGSMWTFNVVRAMYEAKGFLVLPETIPPDESDLIKNALHSAVKENEVYCIKTHKQLNNSLPTQHEVKIICNIRDVRDACLSYMRFMHANFEAGIGAMNIMMRTSDYYLSTFRDNLLSVRFEGLTNNPLNVVEDISNFLKIDLSKGEKNKILKEFSKPNIQKKLSAMKKIKLDANGKVKDDELKEKFVSVENLDGTRRLYEKATAFQSDHITSTRDGEWKSLLDKNKAELLNNLTKEWLLKYGYKI